MFKITVYKKLCTLIDAHKELTKYKLTLPVSIEYIFANPDVLVRIDYCIQLFPFKVFIRIRWN